MDTANMYGGAAEPGITEEIIGHCFAQGDGRRERALLATKLYNSMKGFGGCDNWPNTTRLLRGQFSSVFDSYTHLA